MTLPISVVSLVGATGVGKTALAIQLAEAFNGEIINADSRQIYRHMDIGTAKPTSAEQARVKHHLIDLVDPDYTLSLAEYQDKAYAAINAVAARGRLPLLVGGTGQYVTATLEGWHAPEVPPDLALRAQLQQDVDNMGADALYARLVALDPDAQTLIDARNVRRVIRALEVCLITGHPFSTQRLKIPPPYRVLELGLNLDRAVLDIRLDARIDRMLEQGLLDEVRNLLAAGYDRQLPSMSSLGYKQLSAYLSNELDWDIAIHDFKLVTRQFARRQMTWFTRHGNPLWLDAATIVYPTAYESIAHWLAGKNVQT
jgi:tRNA dimethylallyltransferase